MASDGWTEIVIDVDGNARCSRCNHLRNFQEPQRSIPEGAQQDENKINPAPINSSSVATSATSATISSTEKRKLKGRRRGY